MALPAFLSTLFPNSLHEPFIETSQPTIGAHCIPYNCIAWAYEDNTKWYWPDFRSYWPANIPHEVTLNAFQLLFEDKGYEVCIDDSFEDGFQKIVIYADVNNKPTHAARQLPDGYWTSKLGFWYDISHTIQSMDNGKYGTVAVIMKKRLNN
jgi:hypothetical protein